MRMAGRKSSDSSRSKTPKSGSSRHRMSLSSPAQGVLGAAWNGEEEYTYCLVMRISCAFCAFDDFRSCFFLGFSRSRFNLSVTMSVPVDDAGAASVDDDPMSSASVEALCREPRPNSPLRGLDGGPSGILGVLGVVLGGELRGVLLGVRKTSGVLCPLPPFARALSSALYSLSSVPRIPP